jgi:xanthine dehydrogenase accessory factor
LPAPRITVVGETPIAFALASIGERVGYDVVLSAGSPEVSDDAALVVASHGRDEESALAAALEAGVPYVGLVASRTRGAAVRDGLRAIGVAEERVRTLRTPAGLSIGATTPEEIAVSILAEIVATRHEQPHVAAPPAAAVDPVCGMSVVVAPATTHLDHDGHTFYFCGEGCLRAFEADPASHLAHSKT